MKFTVCGSGDAIGVPGVFCRCANCMSARRNGGREKRSRTGFLLGNTIKFDFGPDTPMQAREQGFDLAELKYLFVTHSHSDHFCPEELWNQTLGIFREEPVLTVFGNAATLAALASYHAFGIPIRSRLLHSGETVRIGPVEVTAIATKHIPTEECLMYLIETPGENVLIATDSDRFPESAYTLLQGHRVDHLFIDATWGVKHRENEGHMGLSAIRDVVVRLLAQNTLHGASYVRPIHISHLVPPSKGDSAVKEMETLQIEWSYDGLTLKLF